MYLYTYYFYLFSNTHMYIHLHTYTQPGWIGCQFPLCTKVLLIVSILLSILAVSTSIALIIAYLEIRSNDHNVTLSNEQSPQNIFVMANSTYKINVSPLLFSGVSVRYNQSNQKESEYTPPSLALMRQSCIEEFLPQSFEWRWLSHLPKMPTWFAAKGLSKVWQVWQLASEHFWRCVHCAMCSRKWYCHFILLQIRGAAIQHQCMLMIPCPYLNQETQLGLLCCSIALLLKYYIEYYIAECARTLLQLTPTPSWTTLCFS